MDNQAEIGLAELFRGFGKIALSGFGGVMPWARRIIVEERAWLTSEEFTSMFGLCQFLPGPNIVNLSLCVGARFQGAGGAVVSFLGLMTPPFFMIIALGALYGRYGELPAVGALLRGISAVAAGLILATGLKMVVDLRGKPLLLVFSAIMLVAVTFLRWPLPAALFGLAPFSIWLAARRYGDET